MEHRRRASGILLHPTSLPGEFGIGDLGKHALEFVDFLARTKQTYWQILPLGPTGYGDSPYQCFSAFAGNTLLVSPETLVDDGLLTVDQLGAKPDFPDDRVDYGSLYGWKNHILRLAFESFAKTTDTDLQTKFQTFAQENSSWLDDYALYRAIMASQDQKPWYEWNEGLRLRDRPALDRASDELHSEVLSQKFYQFLFFRQWQSLKEYANQNGVLIVGDVPIFVALDSADVWCNQRSFPRLGSSGEIPSTIGKRCGKPGLDGGSIACAER